MQARLNKFIDEVRLLEIKEIERMLFHNIEILRQEGRVKRSHCRFDTSRIFTHTYIRIDIHGLYECKKITFSECRKNKKLFSDFYLPIFLILKKFHQNLE